MSGNWRKKNGQRSGLSPRERALVKTFARETAMASRAVLEAAVAAALPEALARMAEVEAGTKHRSRRPLRDAQGRFLGWA